MGRFDGSLQMFVDEPHELNVEALRFWKWKVNRLALLDDMMPTIWTVSAIIEAVEEN